MLRVAVFSIILTPHLNVSTLANTEKVLLFDDAEFRILINKRTDLDSSSETLTHQRERLKRFIELIDWSIIHFKLTLIVEHCLWLRMEFSFLKFIFKLNRCSSVDILSFVNDKEFSRMKFLAKAIHSQLSKECYAVQIFVDKKIITNEGCEVGTHQRKLQTMWNEWQIITIAYLVTVFLVESPIIIFMHFLPHNDTRTQEHVTSLILLWWYDAYGDKIKSSHMLLFMVVQPPSLKLSLLWWQRANKKKKEEGKRNTDAEVMRTNPHQVFLSVQYQTSLLALHKRPGYPS